MYLYSPLTPSKPLLPCFRISVASEGFFLIPATLCQQGGIRRHRRTPKRHKQSSHTSQCFGRSNRTVATSHLPTSYLHHPASLNHEGLAGDDQACVWKLEPKHTPNTCKYKLRFKDLTLRPRMSKAPGASAPGQPCRAVSLRLPNHKSSRASLSCKGKMFGTGHTTGQYICQYLPGSTPCFRGWTQS